MKIIPPHKFVNTLLKIFMTQIKGENIGNRAGEYEDTAMDER